MRKEPKGNKLGKLGQRCLFLPFLRLTACGGEAGISNWQQVVCGCSRTLYIGLLHQYFFLVKKPTPAFTGEANLYCFIIACLNKFQGNQGHVVLNMNTPRFQPWG